MFPKSSLSHFGFGYRQLVQHTPAIQSADHQEAYG